MTKDAHTPGPWERGNYWDSVAYYSDAREDDFTFRVKFPDDMPKAEALANAQLICLAPELLALAKLALNHLEGQEYLQACALIAKTTVG